MATKFLGRMVFVGFLGHRKDHLPRESLAGRAPCSGPVPKGLQGCKIASDERELSGAQGKAR